MDRYPVHEDVELWELPSSTGEPAADHGRQHGHGVAPRVAASLPGAIAGAFLVTALAFGAALNSRREHFRSQPGYGGGGRRHGPRPKRRAARLLRQ